MTTTEGQAITARDEFCAQHLGIAPPPGSHGERAMVRLQRLQAGMMRRRG